MLKARNKKISLLLVLMMLATMFIGVQTASAMSTYSVIAPPTVLNDGTAQSLSSIQIDIPQVVGSPAVAVNHSVVVTLPKDFVINYAAAATSPAVSLAKQGNTTAATNFKAGWLDAAVPAATGNAGIIRQNDREFKISFTVPAGSSDYDVRLIVSLPSVTIPDSAEGPIKAIFTNLNGNAFAGGTEAVVGIAGSGQVTAYTTDAPAFTDAGSAAGAIEINFKENTRYAIKGDVVNPEASSIKLKLAKGFSWAGPGLTNVSTGVAVADLAVGLDAADVSNRTLLISRNLQSEVKSVYRLNAAIAVDESVAKLGDVEVAISGASTTTPSSLIIGTYVNYSAVPEVVGTVPQIYAGQLDQEVADFNITENAAASILTGRSITMKLPAGVKWHTLNNPTFTGSLGFTAAGVTPVGTDGRTLKFTTTNAGATKGKYKFDNVTVMTAVDYTGNVDVTIEGAGIESKTLTLATVKSAITGVATSQDIKIGVQKQDAGTITLTESLKETLINGQDLTVNVPFGIDWATEPTVTVKEGDLDIDESAVSVNNGALTIPIKSQSTKASVIEITNIKLTVDRTVPEGNIEFTVGGPAVDQVNDQLAGATVGSNYVAANAQGQFFPRNTDAAKVLGAKCVTPAPDKTVYNTSSFVIGASKYILNGNEVEAVAASYAKNNRTYLAIRDVAHALGIVDSNIIWDQATGTVTLMKGDKVVQLKNNSNILLINGAPVTMDVTVEASNGRTFLPAAWVAQAFGANASYDAATKTVTIK